MNSLKPHTYTLKSHGAFRVGLLGEKSGQFAGPLKDPSVSICGNVVWVFGRCHHSVVCHINYVE